MESKVARIVVLLDPKVCADRTLWVAGPSGMVESLDD